MDIVNFFEQLTEKFNTELKCDNCWEFSAPLTESALNIVQPSEPCCNQLMLTNLSYSEQNQYNNVTTFRTNRTEEIYFTLYALKTSNLGINNFNEIKEHPKSESKYETIYKPLKGCLDASEVLAFCEILGFDVQVSKWSFDIVNNYQDLNYDGWKIKGTFKTNENY